MATILKFAKKSHEQKFSFDFSVLKNFQLDKDLKAACENHSIDHLAIHQTHEVSYQLPPDIPTVIEIEGC